MAETAAHANRSLMLLHNQKGNMGHHDRKYSYNRYNSKIESHHQLTLSANPEHPSGPSFQLFASAEPEFVLAPCIVNCALPCPQAFLYPISTFSSYCCSNLTKPHKRMLLRSKLSDLAWPSEVFVKAHLIAQSSLVAYPEHQHFVIFKEQHKATSKDT